jgi:hypothetical protein
MVAAAARWVAVAAAAAWHRFWVARADRAGGGEKTMDRRQRPRMEGVGEEAMDWWQRRTGVGGPEVAAAGVGRGPAAAGVGMMRMVFFCEWGKRGKRRGGERTHRGGGGRAGGVEN